MVRRMKACLNGGRSPADHPAVPVTPVQLGVAAAAAVAAGAEVVHLHPRDESGAETLDAPHVGAAVAAVREHCPGTPVGVTTGLWITGGDPAARLERLRAWGALPGGQRPDLASVNAGEAGFAEAVAVLAGAGIGVEAGVQAPAEVRRLGGVPLIRVLIEIMDTGAEQAVAAAEAILAELDRAGVTAPLLLHGEEAACWPLVRHAGRLGLPGRMGLEDTLLDEHGAAATSNADLVRQALAVWTVSAGSGAGPVA